MADVIPYHADNFKNHSGKIIMLESYSGDWKMYSSTRSHSLYPKFQIPKNEGWQETSGSESTTLKGPFSNFIRMMKYSVHSTKKYASSWIRNSFKFVDFTRPENRFCRAPRSAVGASPSCRGDSKSARFKSSSGKSTCVWSFTHLRFDCSRKRFRWRISTGGHDQSLVFLVHKASV